MAGVLTGDPASQKEKARSQAAHTLRCLTPGRAYRRSPRRTGSPLDNTHHEPSGKAPPRGLQAYPQTGGMSQQPTFYSAAPAASRGESLSPSLRFPTSRVWGLAHENHLAQGKRVYNCRISVGRRGRPVGTAERVTNSYPGRAVCRGDQPSPERDRISLGLGFLSVS